MKTLLRKPFQIRDRTYIILLMAPALLYTFIFRLVPIAYGFWVSMTDWNLFFPDSRHTFVGLQNYITFFTTPDQIQSIIITLRIGLLSTFITLLVGTGLAFLVNQELRGSSVVRGMVITAMIMAPIVVGTAWRLMYNPTTGLINYIIERFGGQSIPFLSQVSTALISVTIADAWQQSPFVMIIVLAGLQSLPQEIFEAAAIDGASRFQTLTSITLPMIRRSFMLAILLRIMDSMRSFDLIYTMTQGGPARVTRNINILMFEVAWERYQVGRASAIAIIILLMVMIPCIAIVLSFSRNRTD